jgi:hypothetical protein
MRMVNRWAVIVSAGGVLGLLLIATLGGCVTSQVMVGNARPPIAADQVRIYTEAPANKYEKIAILESSSKRSFSFTSEGKTEAVIDRLRRAAGKLGANGLLLQGMDDQSGESVGGSVGTTSYSNHGIIDVGVMGFTPGYQKWGNALAIYVPPEDAAPRSE